MKSKLDTILQSDPMAAAAIVVVERSNGYFVSILRCCAVVQLFLSVSSASVSSTRCQTKNFAQTKVSVDDLQKSSVTSQQTQPYEEQMMPV